MRRWLVAATAALALPGAAEALPQIGFIPGPTEYSYFGSRLDVVGDRLLVAAPLRPFAYLYDAETYELLAQPHYTLGEGIGFGAALDLSEKWMVIGAPQDYTLNGGRRGAAGVFTADGELLAYIREPENNVDVDGNYLGFGGVVALQGDTAYISGYAYDITSGMLEKSDTMPTAVLNNYYDGRYFVGDPDWDMPFTVQDGKQLYLENAGAVRVYGDLRYVPLPATLQLAALGFGFLGWFGRRGIAASILARTTAPS